MILFRDGLEVEGEMLQKAWHLPLRKLAVAMPITAAISLLVSEAVPGGERIFNIAALAVVCSIIAHGLTDTPGANWIGRHDEKRREADNLRAAPAAAT